jgi:prepilin-type N-terminal cleavage/methylation domain-containing protein
MVGKMKQSVRHPRRSGLPAKALASAGFTLIELSIVLVIIGLVVGGILVGRDLIKAAELRGFVSQIEKFNTAFNTFQLKYNCIPGDCANESQFFSTLQNGDGNGLIGSCFGGGGPPCSVYSGGYDYTKEMANAWAALSLAGLIPGGYDPTSTQPGKGFPLVASQNNNGIMIGAWNGTNYYRTGMAGVWGGGVLPATGTSFGSTSFTFTPLEAFSIDTKMDDGTPTGGNIKWVNECAYNCFQFETPTQIDSLLGFVADGALGASSPYCFNSAANAFNTANTAKLCDAAIPGQF